MNRFFVARDNRLIRERNAMSSACSMPTTGGRLVNLLDPNPRDINIDDIATHLARINRFLGATNHSVAEHSVRVSRICTRRPMAALLHDAHETYIGDWAWPVESALRVLGAGSQLDELRRRLNLAIAEAFGFDPADFSCPEVDEADRIVLATEMRDLMPHAPTRELPRPLVGKITPEVTWVFAKTLFLQRFYEIREACGA